MKKITERLCLYGNQLILSACILLSAAPALASGDTFCAAYKGNTPKTQQYGLCHAYCEVKTCYDNTLRKGSQASCDSILAAYVKQFNSSPPCVQNPAISVEKKTNGIISTASSTPQLELLVGSPISWTYSITNTGDTPVTVNSVVDLGSDNSTPAVTCNTPLPASLAESAVLSCQASGVAEPGPYSNEVTVTATAGTRTLTATALGAYLGLSPGIQITKDNGGIATVQPNVAFTWNINVQNTGQFQLTNITYTDSEPSANLSGCPTTLAVGASASCSTTVNAPAQTGDWNNTVHITAHYTDGLGQDRLITGNATATTTVVSPPPPATCPCVDDGTFTDPKPALYKSIFDLVPGEIGYCDVDSNSLGYALQASYPTGNNVTYLYSVNVNRCFVLNRTSGSAFGFTGPILSTPFTLEQVKACAAIFEQKTGITCTGP
jgi:hypothetical protein